jgi:hypothetical protein
VTSDGFDTARGKLNVRQSLMLRVEGIQNSGLADQIIIEEYQGPKVHDIIKYEIDIFAIGSDWTGSFDYLASIATSFICNEPLASLAARYAASYDWALWDAVGLWKGLYKRPILSAALETCSWLLLLSRPVTSVEHASISGYAVQAGGTGRVQVSQVTATAAYLVAPRPGRSRPMPRTSVQISRQRRTARCG